METLNTIIDNPEGLEEPTFVIKSPSECTEEELSDFEQLVLEAKQVNPENLSQKIQECLLLAFCYSEDKLIGIRAIKRKPKEQIQEIFKKAGIPISAPLPELEIGYAYIKPEHRGKKYASSLLDQLLEKVEGEYLFATTGKDQVRSYLASRGFENMGKPYPGIYNDLIYLMVRNKPIDN